MAGPNLDSIATVIFTSGSTGDTKGVVLSHRNILSNVLQIEAQVHLEPNEVLLGILPFFHSFGYCVTIWTALAWARKWSTTTTRWTRERLASYARSTR